MNILKTNKKVIFIIMTLMSNAIFANDGRTIVNSFLQDWLLPIFLFAVLVTAIGGFIKNFDLIVDKAEQGTFWKGMKNIGILLLYVTMGLAILSGIIAGANAWINTVSVG